MRSAAYNGSGPADALARTNDVLVRDVRTGLFLTAWMAELHPETGVLRYAIAGHERPLRLRGRDGVIEELPGEGVLVGAFGDLTIEDRAIEVEPGDLILAYTDGATDAVGRDGERFGFERLTDLLLANATAAAPVVLDAIVGAVEAFAGGAPPADDLTLLAIRRAPA
jgi:serine phosphatase RsbU (regulator of sigma subunit)